MKSRLFVILLSLLPTCYAFALQPTSRDCARFFYEPAPVFNVTEVEPDVFLLSFSRQHDMTSTFLRFQEYYESPKFRGKIFSRSEFKEWYRTTREGKFSYHTDWGGFNIPSFVFQPFFDSQFKNLTPKEKAVLAEFKNKNGKYYVIGAVDGHAQTLRHEVSHGRFYVNDDYRRDILAALANVDTTKIKEWLIATGYDESVTADETHAYLLNDFEHFNGRLGDFSELIKTLKTIEKKYYP